MEVREADLPGVGKKFAIRTNDNERLTIIIHNTGHREIYSFRKDEDFPFHAIRLDDDEARKLAAILGGAYFQPAVAGDVDIILHQLSIEWFKVPDGSPLNGRTIAQSEIRKRTGASIMAILRDGTPIPNPQPDSEIRTGDTLVVIGSREHVNRFISFARAER
jgi:TrkA domain protein